jgi:hypothetical protein
MRTATVVAIVAAGLTAGSMLGAPAANASGDAPWCAVTQLGEGAMAWNCEYETVEECLPSVTSGNRGSCVANPYAAPAPVSAPAPASAPAPVAAPTTAPTSTTPSAMQNRKAQGNAK